MMSPYVVYAVPDATNKRVLPSNVGAKLPNKLGLYDMIGGVWEWTLDRVNGPKVDYAGGSAAVQDPLDSSGSNAAHRGCGFEQYAKDTDARGYFRSALRGGDSEVTRHNSSIGFRVAATLPADAPDFVVDSGTPKAFAKLSVLPDDCDGWYTIAGIRPENLAAGTYVVQTNTYPWYSGKNWMTNVYNTVKTDWQNCGGIISNAGALGAPYTNQLVVTIFPKEGDGLLDIGATDMLRYEGYGKDYVLPVIYDYHVADVDTIDMINVRFERCRLTSNSGSSGGKTIYPHLYGYYANHLSNKHGEGISFTFSNCEMGAWLYGYYDYQGNMYNIDFFYVDCVFTASNEYAGLFNGDLMFTGNSISNFVGGYRFQFCDDFARQYTQKDAFGGRVDAIMTNNWFENIAPGNLLFKLNRANYMVFMDNTYGSDNKPIYIDYVTESKVIKWQNVTEFVFDRGFDPAETYGEDDSILVHGHEVKFVYDEDPDSTTANVVTNYSLHGDAPKDNLLWSAKSTTYNESLRTNDAPEVEPGLAWVDADGNEFDPETPITDDIVYHLKGTPIALMSLHIQSFAQATNETDGSFVYLAVRATFDSEISPKAFGNWLAKVKGGSAGGNFVAKTSADGEDFDYAESVSMESDGPHPYYADKDDMLVWLKVKLADVTTVKYWKIAFVKTKTE